MEDSLSDEKLQLVVAELREKLPPLEKKEWEGLEGFLFDDLESDLELSFFVVGWSYDTEKALAAVVQGRNLRKASAELAVARTRIRQGEIKKLSDIPHRSKVAEYWEEDMIGESEVVAESGAPFAFARVGEADLDGLLANVEEKFFKLYMVYVFEFRLHKLEVWMKDRLKTPSAFTSRLPRFVDIHCLNCPRGILSTFSLSNISYFKWWTTELGPCYPEQCSHVILVNCPYLFYGGWKLVKNWLPKRTQDKIAIYGSDTSTWLQIKEWFGQECYKNVVVYLQKRKPEEVYKAGVI